MYRLLETRLTGKTSTRFWLELFGNSAQFPIANILLELLLEKPLEYLRKPDMYILVASSLAQAFFLVWRPANSRLGKFLGNLVGPALYTLLEAGLEGINFFSAPYHVAYWIFGLVIGLLQALRFSARDFWAAVLLVAENVARTSILFFMYLIFETFANPAQTASVSEFFRDTSHQYVGAAVLLLGLSIGLANLTSDRYLDLLRQTSAQLKIYSEWLLGKDLLARIMDNPKALGLARQNRVVLFMDIRGFTAWSETETPEAVVALLGQYYQITESVLAGYPVIKYKLSADEIMAILADSWPAVEAALELRARIGEFLQPFGLGAGIGVNQGAVVEGLLGSSGVKFYDVIGDTVNTAKRIESVALAGEILISSSLEQELRPYLMVCTERQVEVKGKSEPVTVFSVQELRPAPGDPA